MTGGSAGGYLIADFMGVPFGFLVGTVLAVILVKALKLDR